MQLLAYYTTLYMSRKREGAAAHIPLSIRAEIMMSSFKKNIKKKNKKKGKRMERVSSPGQYKCRYVLLNLGLETVILAQQVLGLLLAKL